MLKIALSKGRIFKDCLPILAKANIYPLDDPKTSRKLILDTNIDGVKIVVIRATDVPTYVEYGAADIGIVGKDTLLEYNSQQFYELVDLKIAPCKLMLAGPKEAVPLKNGLRIATKYVNVAKEYFAKQGLQVEVIKLYGAMELAPLVDLADYIVDIVDTGNTLKANGLEPKEHIIDISSRLIVNKASMKTKQQQIKALIAKIET